MGVAVAIAVLVAVLSLSVETCWSSSNLGNKPKVDEEEEIGGGGGGGGKGLLRFSRSKGELRILQVADMHYGDGKTTPCEDVLPHQFKACSDLNTTAFLQRMILAVNPHLIVFTGTSLLLLEPNLFLISYVICCFQNPNPLLSYS